MIFLPPITDLESDLNRKHLNLFNDHVKEGKPAFLFLYMDGCGPCEGAKEGWSQIGKVVKSNDPTVVVAQINRNLYANLHGIGGPPSGFPTFRYIRGSTIEDFDSGRSAQAFADWIDSKKPTKKSTKTLRKHRRKSTRHRHRRRHRNSRKHIKKGRRRTMRH